MASAEAVAEAAAVAVVLLLLVQEGAVEVALAEVLIHLCVKCMG